MLNFHKKNLVAEFTVNGLSNYLTFFEPALGHNALKLAVRLSEADENAASVNRGKSTGILLRAFRC